MAEDMIRVRIEVKTEEVEKTLRRTVAFAGSFQVLTSFDQGPADLTIYEIGEEPQKDLEHVQALVNGNPAHEVFLTSTSADPNVLVQALRLGAKEFLTQPIRQDELVEALEKFKVRKEQIKDRRVSLKNGKIIDVIGSKGGVGSTTLAVNLAANLASQNSEQSVALIDMNLLFGEIPLFLDFKPTYNWGEIVRNISRLDATLLMSILHEHPAHLHILPSPTQLNNTAEATPEIMEHLLNLMKTIFDYIVVDSGHMTDQTSMKILEMADTVLLVAILSLPCLTNLSKLLQLFYDLGYPEEERVKVIINRYIKSSDISPKDAESSIEREIFRKIPNDFKLTMSAINQGKTLNEVGPRSSVARSIEELAITLSEKQVNTAKSVSFLGRLLGKT